MKKGETVFGIIICALMITRVYAENINELPMYGETKKSTAQEKADREFIESVTKDGTTREKAADHLLDRGWQAFYQNDLSTAMKRFNQAWLLTPTNAKVFWGFGVVTGRRGQLKDSKKYLEKANQLDPSNPRIMTDLAYSLAQLQETGRAEDFFARATKIDPKFEQAFFLWAVTKFHSGDFRGAWDKVKQARALGGKTLDPNFVRSLSDKMPEQ